MSDLPPRIVSFIESAKAAGMEVVEIVPDCGVYIDVIVRDLDEDGSESNAWRCSWRRTPAGGWRLYYTSDGWGSPTLQEIASHFV